MRIHAGNLKKGNFILFQGNKYLVTKAEFYSPGKGSAVMRTKIQDIISNKSQDYTFKSQESVETINVESKEMQFLYKDRDRLHFMDENDYSQLSLPIKIAGKLSSFLKEGDRYYLYVYNGEILNIRPPQNISLQVKETEDSAKGDTVSGSKKAATLETGAVVMVPLFIKQGETIIINPTTGDYAGRGK